MEVNQSSFLALALRAALSLGTAARSRDRAGRPPVATGEQP